MKNLQVYTGFLRENKKIKLNNVGEDKEGVIQYIYIDSQHQNPLNRVVTAGISDNNFGLDYDRENTKKCCLMPLKPH
jgi:hypothetical protein